MINVYTKTGSPDWANTNHRLIITSAIKYVLTLAVGVAVFMLIECKIQLPQENSIPGIVCSLLERKPLPVIIFYESN